MIKMKTTLVPGGFDMRPLHPVEFSREGIRRSMQYAIEHLEPLTYITVDRDFVEQMKTVAGGE